MTRLERGVVIVGAGISGLSAAYFLNKNGIRCTLVERDRRLGGVIRTEQLDGCLVEGGPDSFIAQKPWAMELISELGIADEVIGSNDSRRKTFVVRDGRLIPLPDGIQFMAPTKIAPLLTTPLLGWGAKLKMISEWLRQPAAPRPERSVAEFVIDHYGAEVNEYLAQPMLAGVYGGDPEELSVNSVLPRFVELEEKFGSVSRGMLAGRRTSAGGSLFLTLRGGMGRIVERLSECIAGQVRVIHDEATAVRRTASGFEVLLADDRLDADAVIVAAPAHRAARLVEDGELAARLESIPYSSSIVGALIYHRPPFTRPLDGFGFLVPRKEARLLAACTWVNTKFDGRAPQDRALLRAFIAGEQALAAMASADSELAERIHSELDRLMGIAASPAESRLFRWERAMAQYPVGHSKIVESIEQRLEATPGLYLAGNAYEGIGIPDCIRRSRRIAETIGTR